MILAGVYPSSGLLEGRVIKAIDGGVYKIKYGRYGVEIRHNGGSQVCQVLKLDHACANGIVHVVDQVPAMPEEKFSDAFRTKVTKSKYNAVRSQSPGSPGRLKRRALSDMTTEDEIRANKTVSSSLAGKTGR